MEAPQAHGLRPVGSVARAGIHVLQCRHNVMIAISHGEVLTLLGAVVALGGLAAEFVAVAGMAFYRIRRALPFNSPIDLQGIGCICFVAGVVILAIGRAFIG